MVALVAEEANAGRTPGTREALRAEIAKHPSGSPAADAVLGARYRRVYGKRRAT
jgi:hypothetical protein